ncbi:hypothetical protein PVAG01_08201 [Phlyctema vagabunda]|uniref:C2H2-type domain-containing protein n=1 Tax=Phlyctema vagabunda TaxID=108571 RepID=A0ABR4P8R4_9HELO
MATFRAVNTSLAPDTYNRNGEETTPTTPRPSTAPNAQPHPMGRDDATTPTRATFGAMANQRPLPASPFPSAISVPVKPESDQATLRRGDSQISTKSRESEDVDMEDSDDGEEGSDDGSVNADGTRSSKKKKSQRFYCTEYPPCVLSFTRSEHLARHIRKHTGERPFQCHCSRRFSRLDNLRQHAQTVHVNEEIPQDSLAATGTRFQRQVRTDRVRPPGSRSRASTAGSQTPQRGHTRNSLSTSSISSIGSTYSQRDDLRRRPAPLVMAGDHRARLSQEMYRSDSPVQYQYRPPSPGGFSTPTSATFSNGQNSPRWNSAMQSPISSHSRTQSLYAGNRTPGRRLSVPSTGNPFQSPHGGSYGPPLLGSYNSPNPGQYSPSSVALASPTTSTTSSQWSRRESLTSASDEAWRRRTWHPDTATNFTSRLQNVTTPNYYSSGPPPQPTIVLGSNAPPLQMPRLPGIESFDPLPRAEVPRPASPARRVPSPMMIDSPTRAPIQPARNLYEQDRALMPQPSSNYLPREPASQLDPGLQRNLGRLDITQGPTVPDTASSWATEANRAVQAQAEQARPQQTVRFEQPAYSRNGASNVYHHSAPPITPKESKRQGWYQGPISSQTRDLRQQRTSPADSSSSEGGVPGTPSSAAAVDYHPTIVHSSGRVESNEASHDAWASQQHAAQGYGNYPPQADGSYTYAAGNNQPPVHQVGDRMPKTQDSNMLRLEALVAVATSEENVAATAY